MGNQAHVSNTVLVDKKSWAQEPKTTKVFTTCPLTAMWDHIDIRNERAGVDISTGNTLKVYVGNNYVN